MSSTIAEIVTMAESLSTEERLDLIMAITNSLKGEPIKPTKKTSKKVDPDAPKRETTWWIKATVQLREMLKPYIREHNASLGEDGKKMPGTVPTTVASMLKAKGLLDKDTMPTLEQVVEAFEAYKDTMSADGGSVASKPSKASKTKFADLSDEEKTEKRKASAAKAAATRKAKKEAAAAAEAEVAEPKEDVPWMHGGVAYLRIDNNLWEAETDKWVGTWDEATKKINKKIKEPKRNVD